MKKIGEFVYRCCFWSFVYVAVMVINLVIYDVYKPLATIVFVAALVLSVVWFVMWIIRTVCRYKARKAEKNAAGSVPAEIETDTH